MDKENENNASVEGITTAVFCREGDLKQFTDVFARLGRSCTAAQKGAWTKLRPGSRSMTPRGS